MQIKLRTIELFCAVVEEQSISRAAQRAYLSQPAVSARLTELEKHACVPLLERSHHGITLTADGAIFYEKARRIVKDVAALQTTVDDLQQKANSKLRFACCVTVGEHLLPKWLGQFKRQDSYSVPAILMGNDQMVIDAVENGNMPIGIIASEQDHDALEITSILEDELIVVVAPQHPWAGESISASEFAGAPFVAREKGSTLRSVIEQTLSQTGALPLNVIMELGSTTAIKEAVESGLGFSILSYTDARRKLEVGSLVRVEGMSIPWSFKLVRNPLTPMNHAEEGFHEFVLNKCNNVQQLSSISQTSLGVR